MGKDKIEGNNIKENKSKLKKIYENEWFKTILISLITTLFTQFLTYYFWTKQFQNGKEQKLLEYKLSSFDKYSSTTGKSIYLSEFTTRLKIEQYIEEQKIRDSIMSKSGITIDTLDANTKYKIHEKLKNKYPIFYENYMKFLEYQNEYNSTASTTSIQFNKNITEEINKMSDSFLEKYLTDKIVEELKKENKSIYNFNKDKIVNSMLNEKYKRLSLIINGMMNEIKQK